MPCAEEKGLFPGRAAGLVAVSSALEALVGDDGPSGEVAAAGESVDETGSLTREVGAASCDSDSTGAGVALGAAFAAGAVSAGAGLSPSASSAARSLRATGGSIVDETPRTYSPKSFSFASATFESIPYSCAIS